MCMTLMRTQIMMAKKAHVWWAILFGLVGTIWDITRLFSGTLTHLLVEDGKFLLSVRFVQFLSPPVLTWLVLFCGKICLPCFAS